MPHRVTTYFITSFINQYSQARNWITWRYGEQVRILILHFFFHFLTHFLHIIIFHNTLTEATSLVHSLLTWRSSIATGFSSYDNSSITWTSSTGNTYVASIHGRLDVPPPNQMVDPTHRQPCLSYEQSDKAQCISDWASPFCRISSHPSWVIPLGIPSHQFETPNLDADYLHMTYVDSRLLIIFLE